MTPDNTPRQRNAKNGGAKRPGDGSGRSGTNGRLVTSLLVAILVGILVVPNLLHSGATQTLSYTTFLQQAAAGHVNSKVAVANSSGVITGTLRDGTSFQVNGPSPVVASDMKALAADGLSVTYTNPSALSGWLNALLPVVLMAALFLFVFGRLSRGQMGSMMSITKSRAKLFDEEKPATTFADVAGYQGVKQEISEVVEFLKNPGRYKAIGAKIPKGVLLVGPPGTGKTLIARAVAGEAGVPFYSVSGSDFMEMFVGVGASRVRDLFSSARKNAPAIIFVDEIDSIGRKRGAGLGGGHDEREQTLNQMLSEMDGFDPTEGIVMIAATNRPDVLDTALLRPGRFDRQIVVPLPDLEERVPILQVHARNKQLDTSVDLTMVARGTPGMSGADLANLVNEAALHAVRRGATTIAMEDFEQARDRVWMGQKRDTTVLNPTDRARVALHEAGHATLAYVLPHADPLHKITIIPRGMALGVTMTLPEEDHYIDSKAHIEDSICMRMGGRVAELIAYGDLSTGAADDLQRNTELARRMVTEWGMSKEVGPMAWGSKGQVFLGEDLMQTRDYSDKTAKVVDNEVERILREQEARAIEYLTKHQRGLEAVAEALLAQETIDGNTAARLIDEAYGQPVHPEGTKSASFLQPASGEVATPATPPAEAWAPPSLPTA
jgi:cell division protease FtsH